MKTISKFDYKNPNIFRHSDNHFPNGFGFSSGSISETIQLCNAFNEICNFITKILAEFF